jgi:hypothetical protein
MEIKPDDDSDGDEGNRYMNTIITFTTKRIGYLAVVLIIGSCTLWWAMPYANMVFNYKDQIDGLLRAASDHDASLKTIWTEFSATREDVGKLKLQQDFLKEMMKESPGDARRDTEIIEIERRLDQLESKETRK